MTLLFNFPLWKYSEYIDHIKNPEHWKITSKFRIGYHNLKIETGRFTIPKNPESLRVCDHCMPKSVEDEMHFIFSLNIIRMMTTEFPFLRNQQTK